MNRPPVVEENITTWKEIPFVSVCTPTFNRRPFIKTMIECFNHQTYPKNKIEWIIIDDGTDKIGELVKSHPSVSYYSYDEKMTLGKKRNLMHKKCKGDIIVYMDDDDYYPPERIQHSVFKLMTNKDALCGGSSEMYIYFKHINQLYQFGPYGEKHATAGTFAFKRKLLKQTKYDDDACLAEEKNFLKNYTIPFVQFDPMKTILVFSHNHNTYDKKQLLENQPPKFVKPSDKELDMFIKKTTSSSEKILQFFMEDIDSLLKDYRPGIPEMKPDVLNQIFQLKTKRESEIADRNNALRKQRITITDENSREKTLTIEELCILLQKQRKIILNQLDMIEDKNNIILSLRKNEGKDI